MRLNIIKQRSLWWTISAVVIAAGIIAMIVSWTNPDIGAPLRPGLDFVGGTKLQVELDCTVPENCDRPIDINTVREVMESQGQGGSTIQIIGEKQQGVTIRTKTLDVEQRNQLQTVLKEQIGTFDPKATQISTVGPTLGRQIFIAGALAILVSFVGILIYLTIRFQFDYAFFAFVALFHDVFVTMGIFSILGLVAGVEVDSLFVVAILTIIGFSVNDTVVIYDRVREVISLNPEEPIDKVVDDAVNQTLTRSINTSFTTMLPLFAIYLFGGETLKNFALALIIGFIAGAYSSIFIASTMLAWWRERHPVAPPKPKMVKSQEQV
ncbi:MAG: protein translocase subunit SecF [Coleofasciculaceae cyanobacterium SM2_1_6]|nr:protein translocase subunit SecF [Coleofasciculaceae cyanobacterium SM2_1_6]